MTAQAPATPLLIASYGGSEACPACGCVPPPTEADYMAARTAFRQHVREQARQCTLLELDRRRPYGATAFWIATEHGRSEYRAGRHSFTEEWDVVEAFEHFERLGVVKVRNIGGKGKDAIFKARLTISRRGLHERMDNLVQDAPAGREQ